MDIVHVSTINPWLALYISMYHHNRTDFTYCLTAILTVNMPTRNEDQLETLYHQRRPPAIYVDLEECQVPRDTN